MGCNCKKVSEISDKYGEKEEETIGKKIVNFFYKIILFAIAIVFGIVLTPVLIFIVIYTLIFKNSNMIVLPKFMSKYMS